MSMIPTTSQMATHDRDALYHHDLKRVIFPPSVCE